MSIYNISIEKYRRRWNEDEFTRDIEKVLGDRKTEEIQKLIMKYAYYKNNLELVRYFNPKQLEEEGEFGKGWHLLIPYKIKPFGDEKTQFKNVIIPAKMHPIVWRTKSGTNSFLIRPATLLT